MNSSTMLAYQIPPAGFACTTVKRQLLLLPASARAATHECLSAYPVPGYLFVQCKINALGGTPGTP
eukprot:268823-Rhodomonas_salina.1